MEHLECQSQTFSQLMDAEGIDHRPYGTASVLERHTFRIRSAEHMRRWRYRVTSFFVGLSIKNCHE